MANQAFDREIPRLKGELSRIGITDEKTINEQIEASRKAYIKQVGDLGQNKEQTIAATEDQMNVIKDSINRQLSDFLSPYMIYLPYVVGLSFFLTLIFFSAFFTPISDLLLLLLFKSLLLIGIVSIKTRTEEVEFLET